ncbi:hypothetical protein H4N49_36775 [Streptomyces sp. DHE17-7]|nr:hypothetical protein [Streptomyces sp. DHE17-7]
MWRVGHGTALDQGFPTGPYTCRGLTAEQAAHVWHMSTKHSYGTHPSPYADPALKMIANWERCGFDSADALEEWFSGWFDTLHEAGFRVWVYEVPEWAVRVGRRGQAVFDSGEAVEIESYEFRPTQLELFPTEGENECFA